MFRLQSVRTVKCNVQKVLFDLVDIVTDSFYELQCVVYDAFVVVI